MPDADKESGELESLLVDIQRTIRENTQFICNLKAESDISDGATEESDGYACTEVEVYEEL